MASLRMGFIASIWATLRPAGNNFPIFRVLPVYSLYVWGSVKRMRHFYICGEVSGAFDGRSATLSTDGYCYSPSLQQWQPVSTPIGSDSVPVALGGGAGIALTDSLILCTGGVNKDIFLSALQREEMMKAEVTGGNQAAVDSLKSEAKTYMLHPAEWYRFNDRILIYNTRRDKWEEAVRSQDVARAGAALTGQGQTFFNINGELKPGIRTPEIAKIMID